MSVQIKLLLDIPIGSSFPTIATIPFKKGLVSPDLLRSSWHLINRATGQPHPSHKEVIALWPDKTVKWIHLYADFTGGIPYAFQSDLPDITFPVLPIRSDESLHWEIEVEDREGIKWRNTIVERSNLTSVPVSARGPELISDKGGWHYNGSSQTKMIEIDTPVVRVTRYEGWLQSGDIKSYLRYCTRVTMYAGTDLAKISHSVIFPVR